MFEGTKSNYQNNDNIFSDKDINVTNIIDLDQIKIEANTDTQKSNIFYEDIEIKKREKKYKDTNYWKIFILSFLSIFIAISVSISLHLYNKYLYSYYKQTPVEQTKIIEKTQQLKSVLYSYIGIDFMHWAGTEQTIVWDKGINTLNEIVASNNTYIKKKNILNNSVQYLSNTILSDHIQLDTLKKTITKESFFPNDIANIISTEEQISSIYNSLLSLEAIKFSSAINVFPYLNSFIEGLHHSIQISKSEIQNKINNIISRWDKDINLYIKNCYLNPFEINYNCDIMNDFEKYYLLNDEKDFDNSFFKQLMKYTDIKLEQTELPSFSIDFQKFDKNSNQITFNININTFKEDEIELAKKGILSPHVFILNNLVNNLKQSRFILGDWIMVKTLKNETKTINIGSAEFTVNNSNKSFTVSIQKESEREIYDFSDIND